MQNITMLRDNSLMHTSCNQLQAAIFINKSGYEKLRKSFCALYFLKSESWLPFLCEFPSYNCLFFFTHYSFYWFTQHNWQEGVPNVSAIATSMLSWAGILLKYSTKWKKQKNKKTYKAFKSTPYYACSVVKLPRNMSGCQSLSRQLALQCSRNSSKGIKLNQLENFGPCHTSSSPSKPDRYINIKKKKKAIKLQNVNGGNSVQRAVHTYCNNIHGWICALQFAE